MFVFIICQKLCHIVIFRCHLNFYLFIFFPDRRTLKLLKVKCNPVNKKKTKQTKQNKTKNKKTKKKTKTKKDA